MRLLVSLVLLALLLLAGCVDRRKIAVDRCVEMCHGALARGEDLSRGPCLSNQVVEDWVCDVAHWPRLPVDNLPENQCPAYGKTAHHFVEVDENCQVIRVV